MSTIYARRLLATLLLSIRGGASVGTGGSSPLPHVVHWSPTSPSLINFGIVKRRKRRREEQRKERRKKNSLDPNSGSALPIVATTYTNHFGTKWTTFPMHQSVDPWTVASQCAVRSRAQVAEQLHANSDSDTYTDDMPTWLIRNKQLPLSIHMIVYINKYIISK